MTLREGITWLGQHPQYLLIALLGLPLLGFLMNLIPRSQRDKGLSPWIYSLLTHLACLPGTMAAVLLAYSLFFTHENLLDVNLLVYFGPLASMLLTLAILGRQVRFQDLPGFDRLAGLITLIAISFGLVLMIRKLFIGIFFVGSFVHLLLLGVVIYALLQWAWFSLTRRRHESRRKFSSYLNLRS